MTLADRSYMHHLLLIAVSKRGKWTCAEIRRLTCDKIQVELPFFSHLAFFAKKRKIGAFFREKMREMRKKREKILFPKMGIVCNPHTTCNGYFYIYFKLMSLTKAVILIHCLGTGLPSFWFCHLFKKIN